ncbi:NADP-dependent oxidoreductase [Dissophora ornata]|nr:hypothetical protein BGZ58_003951 [Dissophora ornata]KAI8595843.1 NADP-dependent oxidoreductase [Dissophora ornata]
MAPITNTRVTRAKLISKEESFTSSNFKIETVELDVQLKDGEVLVRNLYLPLDPYTRYSFDDQDPAAIATIGQTINAFGISEVIESKNPAFPVKSIVLGFSVGWEQYTVLTKPQQQALVIPDAHNPKIPLTEYANVLGVNGLTSYAAVETLVQFKKDQPVYISSAAGPVGSFFGILAKRKGAFVIGSAGSDEKVQYLLNDLGFDAAFNYKTKDTRVELDAAAPNGIEIYFDLVGGETLDIALEKLKTKGQVVAIGSISAVGAKTPYLTKNLGLIVRKALTINGFTAFHHMDKFPKLWNEFGPLIANGEIKSQKTTIVKGVENAGKAFADYLSGSYHGKVVVEVASL